MKNKFLLLLYFCSINCLNLIFAIESIRLPYTVSNYNIDLFDQDNTKARVILNLNFIESGEITIDVSNLSKKTMEIVSIKSKNINKNQSEIIILDCTLKKSGYQRFDLKINFIPNDESIKNLVNYSKIPIYIDTKEGKIINYSLNRPEKKYTMEPKIINRFPNIKKPIAIQFSQNNSSINNDENSSANKKSISRISTYNITIQISGAITYENVYGNILGVPNVAVWLDWDFDHNPSTTYLPYDPQGSLHVEKDITDMNGNYYFSFTFINSPYPANYYSDIIRVYANNNNDAAYDGDLGYGAKFTEYYYIDISQSSTSIYSNSADIEVFVDQGSALRYLFRARQFSINELDFTPHLLRYYYRYNEDISFFCEPGNCGGMDMGSPRIVFNSTPRSETAYHESGHYIEYDKVGFLVGGGDDPHWFRKETNHIQAWKEGWAEFCSAATTMYWYSIELPSILEVNGVDIESPYPQVYQFLDYSQGQLFSNRDNHKVEGAIACFFYSLWDGVDRRAPNYIGDNDDISYAGSFILNNLANRYNQIGQLRGSTHIEAYKVAILSFLDNQNDASVNALYNALILRSGTAKPAQPTSITINGNYNSRTISWNDNTCPDEVWYTMEPDYPLHFNLVENNETGFKIYRKQTSDTWNGTLDGYTHVGTVGQDIVSWTDNDDLLGRYSYVVVAYNASGNSIPKAESKILINDFPQEISSTLTLDNADYYCDGTTISSGTLTIKPGARIFIKAGKDIIVKYNTNAKIIAIGNSGSSIKFLKQDGSAWGDIHLMTPGNTFKYCIFDGGTNNVQVHHNNNTFELCTFKNATNCGLYAGGLNYTTQYRSNFSVINCLMDR